MTPCGFNEPIFCAHFFAGVRYDKLKKFAEVGEGAPLMG